MRMIPRACVLAALLFVPGCGDLPLAPASLAGSYALVAVDGRPLPTTLGTDPASSLLLTADTMRLHIGGLLDGRRCARRVDYVSDTSTDQCFAYTGSFDVRPRSIDMVIGCQPGRLCTTVVIRTATLDGDALLVGGDAPRGTMTFRRIPE